MAIKPKATNSLKSSISELKSISEHDYKSTDEMLKMLLNQTYPEPSIYEIDNKDSFLEDALISKINHLKRFKN